VTPSSDIIALWPLAAYAVGVLILIGGMLGVSAVLGERHDEKATGDPYESGIRTTGSARVRFSVKFYVVAMLFVIFDLEAAFVFSWAVAARELGWAGYIEMLVFVIILLAALIYLWRMGALDWAPSTRRERHRRQEGS
jgi:NADH-quinone oxidoreductase subunit A